MTLSHAPYAAIIDGQQRKPGNPTDGLSPFPPVAKVIPLHTSDFAAATRFIERHATDTRDADRLKRALGLVGAR